MKRKLLSMALVLSLFTGVMALPAVAAEDPENLLAAMGPDFESIEDSVKYWGESMEYVTDPENAQSGNVYLQVPADTTTFASTATAVDVSGYTTYTLSFWVRSGSAESGRILIRNLVGGTPYSTWASNNGVEASPLGTDIVIQFGHRVEEGEERSDWYQVKRSFTTASDTTKVLLQVYSQYTTSSANDMKMCLDNFCLVEGTDNLLYNGALNTYASAADFDGWGHLTTVSGATVWECVEDPAALQSGNMVYKSGQYYQLYQYVALPAGQYKLSYRFRGGEGAEPWGGVSLNAHKNWPEPYSICRKMGAPVTAALKDTWLNYTTYFTIAADGNYAVGVGDRWETAGRYYDDIVLSPADDNTIEYVTEDTASVDFGTTNNVLANISFYRGNTIGKISDVTASGGERTFKAIGHYLAEDVEKTEEFSMISAVYKINKTTDAITLHSLSITDGQAEPILLSASTQAPAHNSENIMATVTVPAEDDTYTYEVKSFLWSSAGCMIPESEVFTLSY